MRRGFTNKLRSIVATAITAVGALVLAEGRASAQDVWELAPVKVEVLVAHGPSAEFSDLWRANLLDELASRAAGTVGPAWSLSVTAAPERLARRMLRGLETCELDDLPPDVIAADKVVLLAIGPTAAAGRLAARELDVRTQLWGPVVTGRVAQRELMADECFRLILRTFRPLGQVEAGERGRATVRLQGGALAPPDPGIRWLAPGDVLRVAVRYNDRDGSLRQVRPIDWTYLVVDTVDEDGIQCAVQTGLRSPLSRRRRGLVEPLALAIGSPGPATRLELRSLDDEPQPLIGYEIIDRSDTAKPVVVGRTDSRGAIEITAGPTPVRDLWVRNGSAWLAKLPVAPGAFDVVQAQLPDDGPRFAAEGFLGGFQEELVDVVTRRQVLVSLVALKIEQQEYAAAEELLRRLRRLPGRQQLSTELVRQQRRITPENERQERQINKLFEDTLALVNRHLDPRPIDDLETRLIRSRQSAGNPAGERSR